MPLRSDAISAKADFSSRQELLKNQIKHLQVVMRLHIVLT